jgi:alkanesulfonate monooxygenase SsuD/methylene tetrahydromethanopterin reductase-like flavin-dependent oxidoreductase (luciferase family)
VGGSSKPALRRAARLGDGWYGLRLSPEEAGRAIEEMNRIGRRPNFTLSLRLQIRVGGAVDGADPATTLHGDPDAVVDQLQKYSDIGIEQVVIEPFANDLADFLEQMRLFAQDIVPEFPRR